MTLGLLTDLHYDGSGEAMNRLYEAVNTLNLGGVGRLVVMGDLVDAASESHSVRLLREVAALCGSFRGPTYFMHGNHDLDHLSKGQFYQALGRAGDPSRFHFEHGGYAFICIDGNFSPDGTPYDHGNFQWRQSYLPEEQIEWLRGRLAAALQPVVVITHQRIDIDGMYAVANSAAVREMISLAGKVVAVFQGHQHADDLRRIGGKPFYTLAAHKDGAGPAVVRLGPQGVRLLRDFQPLEPALP